MWNDVLRRINTAKYCIVLLNPDTAPAHCAPYGAAKITREFEKSEMEKILTDHVSEPAQTNGETS